MNITWLIWNARRKINPVFKLTGPNQANLPDFYVGYLLEKIDNARSVGTLKSPSPHSSRMASPSQYDEQSTEEEVT
jgi:hypothetical protein